MLSWHGCDVLQIMADIMTIEEHFGRYEDLKVRSFPFPFSYRKGP